MKKIILLSLVILGTASAQDMVSVPGGTFTIGGGSAEDERPAVEITIDAFQMDKTPVTNAEYDQCVASGTCSPAHYTDSTCLIWSNNSLTKSKVPTYFQTENRPVVCVSWYQARKYCQSVGKRLPSEAEWEFAATNGGTQTYSWGNETPTSNNSFFSNRQTPETVGSLPAGAFQLQDMNGTVWEWTNDRYERDYYQYISLTNPGGPAVGRFRSIRGGGWYSSANMLTSRNRHWFAPEAGEVSVGFRCVR